MAVEEYVPYPPGPKPYDIRIGEGPVRLRDFCALARGEAVPALSDTHEFRKRLAESHEVVTRGLETGEPIYGVTTGVGASVGNVIPESLRVQMPLNIMRMHGVGTGRILDDVEAAGVVAARLISLARGHSGVRPALLAVCQGLDLRDPALASSPLRALHAALRKSVPMLVEDRRQDRDIAAALAQHRAGELPLPGRA